MMESYSFSTVNGVLPLGVQRAYMPRASRPHLAWAAPAFSYAPARALGEHCRLKGDGTAARETPAAQEEREKDEEKLRVGSATAASSSSTTLASKVTLRGLLTTDGATGTQLNLYHDLSAPGIPVCSSAIPSQRRMVALCAPSANSEEDPSVYVEGNAPLYVSDDAGSVFIHRWNARDGANEPNAKRHCGEQNSSGGSECDDAWTLVATAHSHVPSTLLSAPSSLCAIGSLFTVTRGPPGWAGLTVLNTESKDGTPQLISAREFYHDMRVIDPVQQEVVRVYGTTHPPTGLLCPSLQAAPHCVLVTEGCLATLFDVRCPGAVLSLREVYAAQAEWTEAKEAATTEKLQQQQKHREDGAVSSNGRQTSTGDSAAGSKAVLAPPPPPLVPGRLTSTVGQVRDVCSTANPFEVACAVDRALCVYDLRKFNRLFTSSSVLKYVIGGVTPVAGGRGIVCTGIDSEVRLVPLYEKASGATGEVLSLAARAMAQPQKKRQRSDTPKNTEGASKSADASRGAAPSSAFDVDAMGPGGTFRTRLSTSVSCTSVWQGGWVSTQNLNSVAAVGVSLDGEVLLAQ
ncbi:hypothetical protein ABL78_6662 [Leptomonas seymouri]|uniref:Uncharacterized protein n=1 Tax=Leptomonas seymouri TaxID=5684 RepID=A0A0N1II05_LEPSE|nr:hypothetical protein ABL78_6662 [Leptomonas seymouri]|eukprot:KPI84295.1 hypothetical protein ABL78_6662 [Leptomonas seymouri]